MNEFFILLLVYHLICFADFVNEVHTRNILGWSMIATMMTNIAINFSFILYGSFRNAYLKCKTKYWERKHKKAVL